MNTNLGTITLIGSGELTESMAKVHRNVLLHVGDSPQPVFLDTPAGFELNVDEISAKAVEYFKQKLNVDLEVASFKSRHANEIQVESALHHLRHANYIFAGPGSPTYAVSHWRGTPVWELVRQRWRNGAHLVLASAAAISIGYASLPVYEIFKAGHELCWMDGLHELDRLGLRVAVVPHWNNAEGGTYDTRFCFMGESRFRALEEQLEPGVATMGIDEHTAITLDPATHTCHIMGAGKVTWRYAGSERVFPSGATMPFEELRTSPDEGSQNAQSFASPAVDPSPEIEMTTQYLEQLTRAMQASSEPDAQRELIDHAHDTMHELAQGWREADDLTPDQTTSALLDLLILTRTRLRASKQFGLADQLREDLGRIGLVLQDTPTGTIWRQVRRS